MKKSTRQDQQDSVITKKAYLKTAKKVAVGVASLGLGSLASAGIVWAAHPTCEGGACVELAALNKNMRGIRDSKNPNGGILTVSTESLDGFFTSIHQGKFDK